MRMRTRDRIAASRAPRLAVYLALGMLGVPAALWSQGSPAALAGAQGCGGRSLVLCVQTAVPSSPMEGPGRAAPATPGKQAPQLRLAPDDEPQPHLAGPIIGGVLGGAAGFFLGGFAGTGVECGFGCSGEFAGFIGFILGGGLGEVLGVAVGTHLGNGSRGQLGDVVGTSLSVALLGLGLASVLDAPGILLATVPVQIGASVYIERSGGDR